MTRKEKEWDIEKLAQLVRAELDVVSPLSQMELDVEEEKRRFGQENMDKKLAKLPVENGRPKSCPLCGKNARVRAKDVPRTFQSLSGSHTIRRNYHFCEVCKEGFYPQDYMLGLPKEGEVSEELARRLADFAVNDTYEAAEHRWNLHYPNQVSANQFRQVAKRLGRQVEECNAVVLQSGLAEPLAKQSETLYVMSDGGMVPMRGKWSEAKLGVLFRAEHHLSHRVARRGQITQARYVAVLGEQEEFKEEMKSALQVENAVRAKRMAWVGDGAAGIWSVAEALCPSAIQILDWHHAVEHAMDLGKAMLGEESPYLLEWKIRAEELLFAGNGDALVAEVMACLADAAVGPSQIKAMDDFVRYCRNHQHRMRYAEFISQGLLIGSGIVESGHRHVIQHRMKKAGQHWGERGGRQMARMRAAYKTAGPFRFYKSIQWAHRQSRAVNALPKPRKLRASNR